MNSIECPEIIDYEKIFTEMVVYIRSLGLTVNTTTKARGHQGFFLKNRIDISANIPADRKIEVLIHEFTHYIHSKIDAAITQNHDSLEKIFPNSDYDRLENELFEVTKQFDKNKGFRLLQEKKASILSEIKDYSIKIKNKYSDFKRSEPYKKIERIIKKTDAKYLLKYDRVRVKNAFFGGSKDYSVSTLHLDFPQFDTETRLYLLLKAKQRTLKRINARINRLNNYYRRPSELFARFVEALFVDTNKVTQIAPYAYLVFCRELANNRYLELAEFINKFF